MPAAGPQALSLHPIVVDVGAMVGMAALFLAPAAWLFGRPE
ncbi:MAG: hypothetical protein P8174_09610 [Gemmatimonadota bacterium]